MFILLAGLCLVGGLIVSPTAYREYTRKKEKIERRKSSEEAAKQQNKEALLIEFKKNDQL